MNKLDSSWKQISKEFKLTKILGEGAEGLVLKAVNRTTKQKCAIKRIECSFDDMYKMRYILREITILRQMSEMKNNLYTPKLISIILNGKDVDIDQIKCIFLITECFPSNLRYFLSQEVTGGSQQSQFKVILYNMICAIKFIHSANIMHRDIKPDNILIDSNCHIKFCDFGLSRGVKKESSEDGQSTLTKNINSLISEENVMSQGHSVSDASSIYQASSVHNSEKSGSKNEELKFSPKLQPGEITQHLVSRWYRPPEIILTEAIYNTKIDIWSMGCIFVELAYIWDKEDQDPNKRFLFQGQSCYPLSPMKNQKQEGAIQVSQSDQLMKILEILGPQSEKTVNDFNEQQRTYLNVIQKNLVQQKKIDDMFTNIDPQLLDLIKQMLTFSPVDRISAEECMKSPYFDEIRNVKQEEQNASQYVECVNEFKSKEEAIQFLINEIQILNS